MLGCQDFCGYYDWTFGYIRRRWGQQAVSELWADAIGGESQSHYLKAALADGLKGLLRTWDKTGHDEHCEWTFTLDEQKNVLRWDMRQCPSKGFLLNNDLNADEDYCDHCMGWIIPLLAKAGIEVVAHEHNHCGQCWAEMRVRGKPFQSLGGHEGDIRNDPRWQRGYVDRWSAGEKEQAPLSGPGDDWPAVLARWFATAPSLTVLGPGPPARGDDVTRLPLDHVIMTSSAYVSPNLFHCDPLAVLIDDRPDPRHLDLVARRFNATQPERQPLLLYAYLPEGDFGSPAFSTHGLPRPVPILPLLIRQDLYHHKPGGPSPSSGALAVLIAVALGKPVHVAGIDLPPCAEPTDIRRFPESDPLGTERPGFKSRS